MESNRMAKGEVMLVYISEPFACKKTNKQKCQLVCFNKTVTLFVLRKLFTHKYQIVNRKSFYHEMAID